MKTLKERFVKWLEQQPDNRTFDYTDNANCLFCCFIRESEGLTATASAISYRIWEGEPYISKELQTSKLPEFLLTDPCYSDLLILGSKNLGLLKDRLLPNKKGSP